MAKQTITAYAPVTEYHDYFTIDFLELALAEGATGRTMKFEDANTGSYFILKGKGLEYGDGDFIGGTITSATFYDSEDHVMSAVRDFSIKAKSIPDDASFGVDFVTPLLAGNDKIVGSNADDVLIGFKGKDVMIGGVGNDSITGAEGADRMTGGKGNDQFFFADDDKKNVITDFDTDGPVDQHDQLSSYATDFSLKQDGNDTIVRFADGSDVRLLGVKPSDLDDGDIQLYDPPI